MTAEIPRRPDHVGEDLPRPDELRRLTVYGTTAEAEGGTTLAVGVEFPSGPCFANLAVPAGPVTFENTDELVESVRRYLADGPGGDVWLSYEDSGP